MYIEPMVIFTAWAKIYSTKYFCNTRMVGLDESITHCMCDQKKQQHNLQCNGLLQVISERKSVTTLWPMGTSHMYMHMHDHMHDHMHIIQDTCILRAAHILSYIRPDIILCTCAHVHTSMAHGAC